MTHATTPLHRLRLRRQLTLDEVAEAVGVHNSTISRIERADTRASPAIAEELVRFFGSGITEMEILYPERYRGRV